MLTVAGRAAEQAKEPEILAKERRWRMPRTWRRARRRRGVLIIVQNLPVPFDRRVWQQCQALVAAGYNVSVICPKGPGDPSYQQLDQVRIHKYAPPPPAAGALGFAWEFAYCWLRTAVLALRVLVRDGFGAIQACNPPDTYFALAWPFKLFRIRFVFDQHDLCPEVYLSRFGRPSRLLHGWLRTLEWLTYRAADHVISTNDSYREIALTRGDRPVDSVTIVRSSPDPRYLRPRQPRPELRSNRQFLCCYLGIMGPQDGVDSFLHAIDVLVHDLGRDDCHFALLGFGDCLEELRSLARRLRLDEWVTFTGRADRALLADYLSTADVGVSPDPKNPFNDLSTMNKTLEYMLFGLPVVAFDLKETRRSAQDAAVYVAPNDVPAFARAISRLLDEPERRAAMGRFGRARMHEALAWSHQAAAYVGVYDRLLGDPGAAWADRAEVPPDRVSAM
jgi:glycosyltransferase involved in cell wall biosynthesis